jgi:hypothetical protein
MSFYAKMQNASFPMYLDTLHPVKLVTIDFRKDELTCRLTAFDDGPFVVDVWRGKDVRYISKTGVNLSELRVGDHVWVRVRNRIFEGRLIDCDASEKGIFVKAVVKAKHADRIIVHHTNWKGGVVKRLVDCMDVLSFF